jgi:hypothetical protein
METPVDIHDVTLRAQQHWAEDGLSEIMLGLLFIVMGGGLLVKLALPHWLTLDLLSSALTVAGALGLSWGFKKLKERITFPRSGYVALPEPTRVRWVFLFAMFGVVAVATALGLATHFLTIPVVAAVFAACFLWGGLRYQQTSLLWEAFLTLLFAACSIWFTNLSGATGVLTLMVTIGASMAIIGGFRLRRFLRANPQPQETQA